MFSEKEKNKIFVNSSNVFLNSFDKIEQATKTDFDKISLDGTEKELENKIMNDKIVDFTALKDGEKLEGSFYFEKGKMNITLNEDTEKVKTYSVSVK